MREDCRENIVPALALRYAVEAEADAVRAPRHHEAAGEALLPVRLVVLVAADRPARFRDRGALRLLVALEVRVVWSVPYARSTVETSRLGDMSNRQVVPAQSLTCRQSSCSMRSAFASSGEPLPALRAASTCTARTATNRATSRTSVETLPCLSISSFATTPNAGIKDRRTSTEVTSPSANIHSAACASAGANCNTGSCPSTCS